MKKAIIVLVATMFLISCGGSNEQTTTNDSILTPKDSSIISPSLTDSINGIDVDSLDKGC
jgi:hypothetical protein